MSKVLLELTEDHLETGLRGIPVGYCPTSSVDAQKGLFYVGRSVAELAFKTPYEVIFLLYHGREATDEELSSFVQDIQKRASLSEEFVSSLENLPRSTHPMTLLSVALLLAGHFEGKGDYEEDCLNVIAKLPEIVARLINHHAGWSTQASSKPELGYMENFVQLLGVDKKTQEALFPVIQLFDILHFDHGGGNLSTFTGKAIASGGEGLYGALSGAMCALAGPLHGKANQDTLEYLKRAMDALGEDPDNSAVEDYIRNSLKNKEKIYGFGHAVLRVEDPRATLQYELAQKHFSDNTLVKLALKFREAGPKVLGENPKIQNPYPNVDAISGSLLSAAGFPYPEYYTTLFGLSRCVGIAIQIVYERTLARGGKGTPIVRPKYLYRERGAN